MISFYLHAGSDNHGCEAIVRSTVKILGTECRLYSLNSDKDVRYGIGKVCTIKDDIHKPYPPKSIRWFLSAIQTKVTGKIDLTVKFQRAGLLSEISKEDIFLSIGGDNYCYPGTDILAAIDRNMKRKGAKTVLWGCSVEPSVLEQEEVIEDIKTFDLITARESISYNALRRINPNTVQVADPAFTLGTVMLPLPNNWIDGNMVGINISPLILKSGRNADMVYSAYKMLIEDILAHTTYGIALIPHVVCDGNNDLELLDRLYDD